MHFLPPNKALSQRRFPVLKSFRQSANPKALLCTALQIMISAIKSNLPLKYCVLPDFEKLFKFVHNIIVFLPLIGIMPVETNTSSASGPKQYNSKLICLSSLSKERASARWNCSKGCFHHCHSLGFLKLKLSGGYNLMFAIVPLLSPYS